MDSKSRFSSRVDDYVKYRPTYPPAVIDLLRREIGLQSSWKIADIGSGTGISSMLFLDAGNEVFAVEPNARMRQAAERLLGGNPKFHSVNGSADATTLAESSINLIVAAQAFHWFDNDTTRREFARILRPGGYVLLMWNDRSLAGTPFLMDYEQLLLDFGTDYTKIRHNNIAAERIAAFFAPQPMQLADLPNAQRLDFAGLRGRLLSSSYTPHAGDERYEPMLARAQAIFDRHQQDGKVTIEYRTTLFYGQLPPYNSQMR